MKRPCPGLVESAFIALLAFLVFLDQINLGIDVLAGIPRSKSPAGELRPTWECVSRLKISAWRVVVCGQLRRSRQHCQIMVGASSIYYTIVRPA
jgi:hypothetical protein